MEFFNKKEDVIDLELTPYGEYLLSKGDFKPEFYAFFDNEILYDGTFAGTNSEAQNKIKDRIKEVPRLKTQYLFTNTELPNIELFEESDKEKEKAGILNYPPATYIKQYALPWPLGNSSFDSDKAPAWDIKLLYNHMSSSIGYFTSSMHPYLKIPQLDVTIQYETEILSNKTPETSEDNVNKVDRLRLKEFDELHENPPLYEDGLYDFQEDFIVLEINEHNVPFLKENFDIEVFEVSYDSGNKYDFELEHKSFVRKSSVVNEKGLLKSEEETIKSNEEDLELKLLPLDKTYVERFFNVYVDHEIDTDLICKLNPNVKQKGFFISDPLDCIKDKEVNILSSDIYKKMIETPPECD
jgi:hypothetical protein